MSLCPSSVPLSLFNQILVKYTLAGDANLDGVVNFIDLLAVIQNFNKTGTDWARGNFAYGTSTNFTDLLLVIQNFNKTLTPAFTSGDGLPDTVVPLEFSASASIASTSAQLPEAGAVIPLLLGAASLGLRRRRPTGR